MAASEATLTPTVVSKTAPTNATTNMVVSATATNNGQFKFLNDGTIFILVQTGIADTAGTITVTGQALSYNGAAVNIVTTALSAASSLYTLGPFERSDFNDSSNYVHVVLSSVGGLTSIGAISSTPKG
jgi:hypothetical protein